MQQASCLEGGLLLWILTLYLHVNKISNDDDDVPSYSIFEKSAFAEYVAGFEQSGSYLLTITS